mgnify:CR=1 FL=1
MDKHSKKSSSLLHYPVLVVFSLFFIGLFALDLITPDRAYSELESEGYAASVPGKGSFAVRRERAEDDGRRLALTETLRETLRELRALGMTTAELDAIYREEEEK